MSELFYLSVLTALSSNIQLWIWQTSRICMFCFCCHYQLNKSQAATILPMINDFTPDNIRLWDSLHIWPDLQRYCNEVWSRRAAWDLTYKVLFTIWLAQSVCWEKTRMYAWHNGLSSCSGLLCKAEELKEKVQLGSIRKTYKIACGLCGAPLMLLSSSSVHFWSIFWWLISAGEWVSLTPWNTEVASATSSLWYDYRLNM